MRASLTVLALFASTPSAQVADDPVPHRRGAAAFAEDGVRVIHEIVGENPGDQFGWVGRDMGDLDGDGVRDFALTAPSFGANQSWAGKAYFYSGRSAELLHTRVGAPADRYGNGVSGQFDANGDEQLDVLVGAPAWGERPGYAQVLDGASGEVLLRLSMEEPGDEFGLKVSGLDDLDGDGCAELAIGAPKADANGADSGAVHVYSGKEGAYLYTIAGAAAGDGFGSAVGGTTGGAHGLLVVGAMKGGPAKKGRCSIYRLSAEDYELVAHVDADATGACLGQYFAAPMGDVDGDGTPDLLFSDWNNAAGGPNTGRVYVHSGADGSRLLSIDGSGPGQGFGTSISVAGDATGDGVADLIVGAWQFGAHAASGGRCTLHSGADGARLASWSAVDAGETLGFDAVGVGDVDGDGGVDFLLTSAWSGLGGARTGRAWVVAGPIFEQEEAGAEDAER